MSTEFDVVETLQELLRFDTSNYGDRMGPDVEQCVSYIHESITKAGFDDVQVGPSPEYSTLIVRVPGHGESSKSPVIIHGHYDVVPAVAENWRVDPFSGSVQDGQIWGRGAVDMKNMVAMMLSALHGLGSGAIQASRDLIFVFFADEEAGGARGGQWVVDHHPELFAGASFAMSEVGGFSIDLGGKRKYLLQTAEKGFAWLNVTAHGRAGHGSIPNTCNAVATLVRALNRLDEYQWPETLIPSVEALLNGAAADLDLNRQEIPSDQIVEKLGGARGFVEGVLRDTAQLTVLRAGDKGNVIPGEAHAMIDCRFLPGREDEFLTKVRELLGDEIEIRDSSIRPALEAPWEHKAVSSMRQVIQELDDGADVLPYCLSGGTDNKAFARLGIPGYGFVPLRLPSDFNFAAMFHGVDERVPIESLLFGEKALRRLIQIV